MTILIWDMIETAQNFHTKINVVTNCKRIWKREEGGFAKVGSGKYSILSLMYHQDENIGTVPQRPSNQTIA